MPDFTPTQVIDAQIATLKAQNSIIDNQVIINADNVVKRKAQIMKQIADLQEKKTALENVPSS